MPFIKEITVPSLLTALFILTLPWVHAAETPLPATPGMPAGMTGAYETLKTKILKVYAAEDKGATYRGYVVNWKDQEIVVTDPLGKTDKKEGEEITFMAQRIEVPMGNENIKMLQFMVMEIPGLPSGE